MTTERHIIVSGLRVEVARKDIRNLHLGVYPPHGRVRVAVPLRVSDDAVRLAVVTRLGWIKRQRARFEAQPRLSRREMVTGESHYVWGQRYRLNVVVGSGASRVVLRNRRIDLNVRPGATTEQRAAVLDRWYRQQLRAAAEPLLERWQSVVGVKAAAWGIKRMKTKWGACNVKARRVWVNLELAKKPKRCLEYIVVHELVHLLERHHDDRFAALMTRFLPTWQQCRVALNREPLGYEGWGY